MFSSSMKRITERSCIFGSRSVSSGFATALRSLSDDMSTACSAAQKSYWVKSWAIPVSRRKEGEA